MGHRALDRAPDPTSPATPPPPSRLRERAEQVASRLG